MSELTQQQPNSIPFEMTAYPQWVIWKAVPRNGKLAKIPNNPSRPSRCASTTDPSTWASYDLACSVAPRQGGIGFVFTSDDPYIGVDLDNCFEDGELEAGAEELVARLGTYTETSPSGNGIHCIGKGDLSLPGNKTSTTPWGGSVEVYDRSRYFTMSGAGSGEISDVGEALAEICEEMFGPVKVRGARTGGGGTLETRYETLLQAANELGDWEERKVDFWDVLMEVQRAYLREYRPPEEPFAWYASRSDAEGAIVYRLVRNGASDGQIIEFADSHLWKHIEERKTRGNRYIEMTIRSERCYVFEHEGLISSPEGGWPRKRHARHRWITIDRHEEALALVKGQPRAAWIHEIKNELGIKSRTGYRVLNRLVKAELVRIDSEKRVHRV